MTDGESVRKALARRMAQPDTKFCQTRHGAMIGIAGDIYITRSLEAYGEYSSLEDKLFAMLVKPGMTVVEVGGHIGPHTVPLAKLCAPGPLHVFEPQQRLFQLLCANVSLARLSNVVAYPEAVGDAEGHALMPPIDYGATRNFAGFSVKRQEDGTAGIKVRLTTLDRLELPACDFIKIDVDGFEPEVIAGARETILRHRPVIYTENAIAGRQQELIDAIDALGYRMYWHLPPLFDPDNWKKSAENLFPHIVSINMYCEPAERPPFDAKSPPIDPRNWTLKARPSPPTGW